MNLQPLIDAAASYYQAEAFWTYLHPFFSTAVLFGVGYGAYKFMTFVVNDIRNNG